jgi:hypothetical protein
VPTGDPIGPLDDTIMHVLQINVTPPTLNPITSIPVVLTSNTVWPSAGAPIKIFTFQEHPAFLIDSTPYNPSVNNFVTQLDQVEIWEVKNITPVAHPFHIHGNHFYILSRQGVPPPPNEQGRKDVVLIPPQETVQLITKYETFCDSAMPYMYHCHILKHEDMGMMGQFLVQCSGLSVSEEDSQDKIGIFPNPSNGIFNISGARFDGHVIVSIYNVLGEVVYYKSLPASSANTIAGHPLVVDVEDIPSGMYFIRLETGGTKSSEKIVIQK